MMNDILDEVVLSVSYDWTYLAEVFLLVRDKRPQSNESEVEEVVLDAIHLLYSQNLTRIGDLIQIPNNDLRFVDWGLSVEEVKPVLRSKIRELIEPISLGDVCWLVATKKGDLRSDEIKRSRLRSDA